MCNIDDRSREQKAIDALHLVLRAKVEAIVKEGFEGWGGTIEAYGYGLEVTLKMREQ